VDRKVADGVMAVYSPDDDGWHLERLKDWKVSRRVFRSVEEARREYRLCRILWRAVGDGESGE
jgi:hypothetical protein